MIRVALTPSLIKMLAGGKRMARAILKRFMMFAGMTTKNKTASR
jgi:hypothetical protein